MIKKINWKNKHDSIWVEEILISIISDCIPWLSISCLQFPFLPFPASSAASGKGTKTLVSGCCRMQHGTQAHTTGIHCLLSLWSSHFRSARAPCSLILLWAASWLPTSCPLGFTFQGLSFASNLSAIRLGSFSSLPPGLHLHTIALRCPEAWRAGLGWSRQCLLPDSPCSSYTCLWCPSRARAVPGLEGQRGTNSSLLGSSSSSRPPALQNQWDVPEPGAALTPV